MRKLMIIIPDIISDILKKGEYQPRYYNPGNLFEEVHILITNYDLPDKVALQRTVGDAKLYIHNLPEPDTHGHIPYYLKKKKWVRKAIDLAKQINPLIIRCHGNWLNGYLASRIKKKLNIPYVVSMHTNPDEELRGRATDLSEKKYWNKMRKIEKISLHNANMVCPVYQPIIPYLKAMGVKRYDVAYNVLNSHFLRKKIDYTLHKPIRLLSVGRHFKEKNPENIILALKNIPDAHLTLVGHGPIQDYLEKLAIDCNVGNRTEFLHAVPNDKLCSMLPDYDIFVVHSEYWEIAKAVIEPLLSGLPVIINKRKGMPVPELQGDHIILVENSPEGYFQALQLLINDHSYREQLGKKAYAYAHDKFAPEKTEAKYVEIYKRVLVESGVII